MDSNSVLKAIRRCFKKNYMKKIVTNKKVFFYQKSKENVFKVDFNHFSFFLKKKAQGKKMQHLLSFKI